MTGAMSGARVWLIGFVGFWLLHAGWTFATPLDGPPDELQHVIRAAGVTRGEFVADQSAKGGTQIVPASIDRGWCFPTRVTVAASCERDPGGDESLVQVNTTAAAYSPAYYLVTGWPLRFWPSWPGIMLSRLINGALMAALLAGAMVAVTQWYRKRPIVAGVLVAATPMTAHLGGAVNPNGLEIAASLALFAALIALLHEQSNGVHRATVRLAGIAACVLVISRLTGPMWLAVIVGTVVLSASRSRLRTLWGSREVRGWLVAVAACVAGQAAWIFGTRTLQLDHVDQGFTTTGIVRFALLDMWPNVANQMVAVTGWSEVLMPRLIYLAWFMSAGLLIFGGLMMGTRVDRWRLVILFLATFVPLLGWELLSANSLGWFNQGRYFLPGAVGLPLLGTYILARQGIGVERLRFATRLFAGLLLPIHLVCLVYTMARWNSGLSSLNPFNGSWRPPYGIVLPLASATAGIIVLFFMYWRTSRVPATPMRPDSVDADVLEPVSTAKV